MYDPSKNKFNLSEKRLALLEKLVQQKGYDSPSVSAVSHRDKAVPVPLSFSQERLWFLDQLEPDSPAYNMSLALRLTGNLNVAALEQSLGEILRRHEVLRTTFITGNDQPVQVIAPSGTFTLPLMDLSALPEEQREAKARELASEEASCPFDLTTGPLLRATLLQLDPKEHVLLVTMHHIVSDGWSMGIFNREFSVLYDAFSEGNPSPLPELPIQYADFAVWQRKWLQGERLEEQLRFWKDHLRGITTLELPADRPRPSVQTFHGATHTVVFPKGLTEALRSLSRKEGATLFMTLLTAFQCLLHRYTGQDDIVVGTPIANRGRTEIEGLIGFFVNTLVMRADTSGNPVFRELLKQVQKSALDAYAHQDLPFERLVGELQPERDLSRNPLFQVMFALQNTPLLPLEMPGLTLSRMEIKGSRTRFDLEVHLREEAEGLKGAFVYNTDLFDAVTIERMAGHYQRMLEGIVADPDQRVSELPLLTDAERHQLLVEWNDTTTNYPKDKCIHQLFEEQVEKTPDAIAVVFEDQQLTYRELNNKANQLAHYLRKQDVGPEAMVGICIERSLEMVICVLGILKAGAAYVPLDPAYPKERLSFMLEDTGSPLLLAQSSLSGVLPENKAQVVCVDQAWETIEKESTLNLAGTASQDNLAYVLYTSGSTGRPKGVAMEHRPLCNLISWQIRNSVLSTNAKTLQFASLSFDVSFQEIFSTWCSGGTLMVTSELLRRDPAALLHYLEKASIDRLFLPFVALQQLAEVAAWHDSFPYSLREVITAGEQLRITPSVARMFERLGNCRLYNQYGPTESHVVTAFELSGAPEEWPSLPPIGRPIGNTNIYLLDCNQKPVPAGVAGELYIGGKCLARGYINRPELTASRFIWNPFRNNPGERLYRTGDIARYLSDGSIEYLGRSDNQLKVRGFRIEPGEIESVLGRHPGVRETAVIARKDKSGSNRLLAYVVLNMAPAITTNELRNFLTQRLPDYMVPSAFVVLDSLPLTPSGKVDRRALPDPGTERPDAGKEFVAPRNDLEIKLVRIWENILDVRPVGITDNFFELGGHSLLAVRVAAEIKKITRHKFPVMAIFQFPTIEQLAEVLTKEGCSVQFSSLVQIQPGYVRLPFFWVHGQQSDTLLPRYLDSQPLYGLIHQGQDGRIPFTTVDDISAHYLKEIRTVQPKGPYLLGGYCFGGMVALEMAQKLLNQGDEVSLLFLLDPPRKCFSPVTLHDTTQAKKSSFQSRVVYHSGNLAGQSPGKKIAYMLRKLPNAFNFVIAPITKKAKKKIKMLICNVYCYLERPLPLSLRTFYLMDIYRNAMQRYTPKLYPGRIILCHSDQVSYGESVRQMIAGTAEVHQITGADHQSILNEPYVRKWAGHLNLYLRKLQVKKEDKKG
jgi:amino acid adenylation domain-containing protein